jgi:hypothetical protein
MTKSLSKLASFDVDQLIIEAAVLQWVGIQR